MRTMMSDYAKKILIVCFFTAIAGCNDNEGHKSIVGDEYSPPGRRVIRFPKKRSIGKYVIVGWNIDPMDKEFNQFVNEEKNWLEARGDVVVPERKALMLFLLNIYDDSQRNPQDFSPLDKLGPKDLVGFAPHPFGIVVPSELERLKRFRFLQYLGISGFNGTNDQCLVPLSNLTHLKLLSLCEARITDSGMKYLKGLKSMEDLNLYATRITDKGLSYLSGMKNLRSLEIGNVRSITDIGIAHLKDFKKLERLQLWNTQITDAGLVHLKGMSKLKWLHLEGTRITDAGLVHLKGMKNLETLNLSGTKVTDAGLVHLQSLPSLKDVLLYRTKVSDKGRAKIERFLQSRKRRITAE